MPELYSSDAFEAAYTYTGDDLGAAWTPEATYFRVWAPTARAVRVRLYLGGKARADDLIGELPMRPDVRGTWVAEAEGDLNGVYYTYAVTVGGRTREAVDPYARAAGVNGARGMVIDLASTNPEGWDADVNPHAGLSVNDAIIYELHVRDLSADESSGIAHAGKFLGLTETGTVTPGGAPTGLDHIRDLGITHLHLLPVYDYGSVDEARPEKPQFNWGYDPVNYNVPEGSYATDPTRGEIRVKEMKRMVKALHDSGVSVVMDVVYNHVYDARAFCVNRIVPGYFSRIHGDGRYANGSGCGNDTASERSMVRKYIVDSVVYWAQEYHIDGFRFDLVGLTDIRTVNEVVAEVRRRRPDVIFYGEGWDMGADVTRPGVLLATQRNAARTPGFAYFNDAIRNAVRGYVVGAEGCEEAIISGFLGRSDWCPSPAQTVNYASCHDNHTLMDAITLAAPDAAWEDRLRMNRLAAAICLMAEGVPFLHAGEEMLRTKRNPDGSLNENSYNAPDAVNSLKWRTLEQDGYRQTHAYYRGLIAFRKAHRLLRLASAQEVRAHAAAVPGLPPGVVAFHLRDGASEELFIIFNASREACRIDLPGSVWAVCVSGDRAGTEALDLITDGSVTAWPISATALVRKQAAP